jgi:hypothetical protein
MAKISTTNVKALFQTGDRPTQENYVDLIDSTSARSTDLGSDGNNESTINGIENSTVFDNFSASEWRSMKYMVSIKYVAGGANKYYSTELNILIDGSGVSVSEYATIGYSPNHYHSNYCASSNIEYFYLEKTTRILCDVNA